MDLGRELARGAGVVACGYWLWISKRADGRVGAASTSSVDPLHGALA